MQNINIYPVNSVRFYISKNDVNIINNAFVSLNRDATEMMNILR